MGLSDHRCDQCKGQPAAIRYTQVDGGHIHQGHLCAACARSRGLLEIPPALPASTLACPECGLAFTAFQQQGRVGCPACYEAFASELLPLLRQIHGRVEHGAGGAAAAGARPARRLGELRQALDAAVHAEEYERAALLRDKIRALEQGQEEPSRGGPGPSGPPPDPEAK